MYWINFLLSLLSQSRSWFAWLPWSLGCQTLLTGHIFCPQCRQPRMSVCARWNQCSLGHSLLQYHPHWTVTVFQCLSLISQYSSMLHISPTLPRSDIDWVSVALLSFPPFPPVIGITIRCVCAEEGSLLQRCIEMYNPLWRIRSHSGQCVCCVLCPSAWWVRACP